MPIHILREPVNMNYIYTALMTYMIRHPSVLKNGITKYTPIIQACDHTGWLDFQQDGLRYTFVDTFTLDDFVTGTKESLSNVNLITNGSFQHNYNHPLVKTVNGKIVPITLKDILEDPASKQTYSNNYGTNGSTLYDYAVATDNASETIINECPIDVRLISYGHPVYYTHTYYLLDGNGNQTTKEAIIGIIKYKNDKGVPMIFFAGTPIREFIAD